MTPLTLCCVLVVALGGGYLGHRLAAWRSGDRESRRAVARAHTGFRDAIRALSEGHDDHELQLGRLVESSAAAHARLNAIESRREMAARWEAN